MLLYDAEVRRLKKLRAERLSDVNIAFAGGKNGAALLKALQEDTP